MNPKWTDEERGKWPYGEPPPLPNGFTPAIQQSGNGPSGVFVEIVAGRPAVSIRCSDSSKLDELTALARKILAAID